MEPHTHMLARSDLVGRVVSLQTDRAVVALDTTAAMAVDAHGLVHGSFAFGAADYAAMLAVNDPNVVLGAAEVRFVGPVRVGATITATATIESASGRKRVVRVVAAVDEVEVLVGVLTCFVLERHVLENRS